MILKTTNRIQEEVRDGRAVLVAREFLVPLGASHGWEAAVLDHYEAMVQTVCRRLANLGNPTSSADRAGGSTYTLDVWPGHPLRDEALRWLRNLRESTTDLRQRIEQYNAANPAPGVIEQVVVYAGQSVIEREPANGGERDDAEAVTEEGEWT